MKSNPIGEVRIYHDPQKDGIDTEFVTCLTEDELKCQRHLKMSIFAGMECRF